MSRRAKQPVDLLLYLILSSIVAGGASGIRDLWMGYGLVDFAIIIAGLLILAWPWIRSTNRVFTELKWSKYLIFPFLAPIALLLLVQLTHSEPDCEVLAFIQIGFAVILALFTFDGRRDAGRVDEKGSST
jgi:hypothetical protein